LVQLYALDGITQTAMKSPKAWLAKKFIEPCACSSGRSYRQCCYRRESVYFVIGVFAALALFGAREFPWLLATVPILVGVAFATKLHYDRERKRKPREPRSPEHSGLR